MPGQSRLLQQKRETLALAETITQGLIASKCVGERWLIESIFCRDTDQLVSKLLLDLGTVVPDTEKEKLNMAMDCARQIKKQSRTDIGLAQLCFDASGALRDSNKTVSLFTAVATTTDVSAQVLTIGGAVRRKQNRAALHALDFLRRFLKGKH